MKAWIRDLVVALALAFIILQFIKPTIVRENSMEPTLHDGDYIFLSRQSYTFGEPKRGGYYRVSYGAQDRNRK